MSWQHTSAGHLYKHGALSQISNSSNFYLIGRKEALANKSPLNHQYLAKITTPVEEREIAEAEETRYAEDAGR